MNIARSNRSQALTRTLTLALTLTRTLTPTPTLNLILTLTPTLTLTLTQHTRPAPGESAFQYKVQVSSLEMVERLFGAVEALDDVACVRRGDMEHMLHDSPASFWAHATQPAAEEEP